MRVPAAVVEQGGADEAVPASGALPVVAEIGMAPALVARGEFGVAAGCVSPDFVLNASARPGVFMPYRGLAPGTSKSSPIAALGTMSQLATSPKGPFTRTPSRYTEIPCELPSTGEARKPR